jgi:exopolysaccharide biosynthesis protein
MERRAVDVAFQSLGLAEHVVVFRITPERFSLRVRYGPGLPAFVSAWEPRARLVFNANFFDENNVAQGLLISDGQYFGQSYDGFGGMLGVDTSGAVRIRSLADEPFQPDEALSQAVQGFPMLIRPGGPQYANEDGARARRTVVGQDSDGRLLVILAPVGLFTLKEMAAWLASGDFGLVAALNLDGGGSTGYRAGPNDRADSLTPVPAVLAVYDR